MFQEIYSVVFLLKLGSAMIERMAASVSEYVFAASILFWSTVPPTEIGSGGSISVRTVSATGPYVFSSKSIHVTGAVSTKVIGKRALNWERFLTPSAWKKDEGRGVYCLASTTLARGAFFLTDSIPPTHACFVS